MQKFSTVIVQFLLVISSLSAQIGDTVQIQIKNGHLEGTLLKPSNNGKVPCVLIIAGSGPTDRNGNNTQMTNNSLKMLAEALLRENIASLRYDKRGIANSKIDISESEARFEDFVSDAKAWAHFLESRDQFSEIVIAGHSEGSMIGILAAQEGNISKFISLAGIGNSADIVLGEQLQKQPPQIAEASTPIIKKLKEGQLVDSIPILLKSIFRKSIQPYLISWFKYDPQLEINKLKCPILIIQGTTDIQVSVNESNCLMEGAPSAKRVIIKNMNHVLKNVENNYFKNMASYNKPDLELAPGLIENIVSFIKL